MALSCNTLCSERSLFGLLLLFWCVGALLLLGEHPTNCVFFERPPPSAGSSAPAHEDPQADWLYKVTHRMTLGPYALTSLAVQLVLMLAWFAQMNNHLYLQHRAEREAERGRRMRQYGWIRCLRSVLDEPEHGDAAHGEQAVVPSDAQRFECVCGCCWLFSTSCTLLIFNVSALLVTSYLLVLGAGTFESSARYAQTPSCRRGVPALVYAITLNGMTLLLYVVLLLVRLLCQAKSVALRAVQVGKTIHNRIQTRRGRRLKGKKGGGKTGSYAQLGAPAAGGAPANGHHHLVSMDPELGLELSDDEEEFEQAEGGAGQIELELHDLSMEDDDMDALFADGDGQPAPQAQHMHQSYLQQPRPHHSHSLQQHAPPPPLPLGSDGDEALDDDTREMLEMLGAPGGGDGGGGGEGSQEALQREHQRRAEAALDAMEAESEALP